MAVGIFDSGLGGLTVYDAVAREMPEVPFVYFGDNAHAPYGVRDADDIFRLTCAGVERLWAEGDESFLPHGRAGGPHDALQPILLTTGREVPNGAACLMAVDGAEVSLEEARALTRVCVLFDGNDPKAVDHARSQWKALTASGVPAQYWSEESGRWQKKAESGGEARG